MIPSFIHLSGQLLNGRQGLNRKILGGWKKHYESVQSAVAGSGFSSNSYVSGSAGSFSSGGYSSSQSSKFPQNSECIPIKWNLVLYNYIVLISLVLLINVFSMVSIILLE